MVRRRLVGLNQLTAPWIKLNNKIKQSEVCHKDRAVHCPRYLTLALLFICAPASAQIQADFTQIGQAVNGLAYPVTMNMCNAGFCGPERYDAGDKLRATSTNRLAVTQKAPAGTSAGIGVYEVTDALANEATRAYIARLQRVDRQVASQVKREFGLHDYRSVYNGIIEGTGLRADSVSDAITAYFMLTWLIANEVDNEPSSEQISGLRRQFAAHVKSAPSLLAQPAKLGEELKLLVVTIHAGLQSASREGTKTNYASRISAMISQQYDIDMRSLRLGEEGFQSK